MPTSSALPETLKSITATKIEELSKQRNTYEASKKAIIRSTEKQTDLLSEVNAALEGSCRIEGVQFNSDSSSDDEDLSTSTTGSRLRNQRRFIQQARKDPSFSASIIRQFGEEISRDLELKSIQHEHAQFFSELVTEWLSNPDGTGVQEANRKVPSSQSKTDMETSSFEEVGRKEMHEQRAQWESIIFSKSSVDGSAIRSYLEKLFSSSKIVTKALEDIRRAVKAFSITLQYNTSFFSSISLKTTIKGLLNADLLSEEKKAILKTFLTNKEVLAEVADVLNMRMISLNAWSWSTDSSKGVSLEMRKQLNGKYRVFMDEDVLDALLLHALGMSWAVEFKSVFTTFFDSFAWQRNSKRLPKLDRERREYYLGNDRDENDTVQSKRRSMYADDYFMAQLPIDVSEGARNYDGTDSDDDLDLETTRGGKGPLETKHSLLHLLITESLLAMRLHGNFTVVRSDFKWFGPSLPHISINAVLKFFGVSDFWLDFFKRFLEAPLRFVQDGPDAQVQIRSCGVPMSHALSDVFGESLMFIMDFAVNQHTSGSYLYRLHDDFWFWGKEEACCKAWTTMKDFASTMGIKFNEEKTGTVRLEEKKSLSKPKYLSGLGSDDKSDVSSSNSDSGVHDHASDEILPKGEIRWGFLRLDAASSRFVVDQAMVDDHTKELQLQLSQCNSVFAYVQAYNAYLARFFSNNFGKPSYAFGRDHVDMMIDTFARVQKVMFPGGSVTDHLRKVIKERFGVKDLPDGFFYWPNHMGGLELRNPLVPLFAMRESLRRTPSRMLEKALDKDEAAYTTAMDKFEKINTGHGMSKANWEMSRKIDQTGEKFMPMDEFLRHREERSPYLGAVYEQLLGIPDEMHVNNTPQIASWLEGLSGGATYPIGRSAFSSSFKFRGRGSYACVNPHTGRRGTNKATRGIQKRFESMQPYWKWILAVHGGEIVKRYGGVQIVDERRVPIGVVGVMRAGKVRWKG